MTTNVPSTADSALNESLCSIEQISSFTPQQIREAVAQWVARDRMDLAEALVVAGLGLYPKSEDILAIGALVSEVNQDWAQAQDCLERLLAIQGEAATSESCYHLVRVMRCRAAYFPALRAVERGLNLHPQHEGLQREYAELLEMLSSMRLDAKALAHAG